MFHGRVARVAIESDRVSEERRVYVACERCPESFHLGEQAEVFVTTAVLENALLVAETVVEGFDGTRGTVWKLEDGELRGRECEEIGSGSWRAGVGREEYVLGVVVTYKKQKMK